MLEKGKKLGAGTFGIVYACEVEGESMAIKRNLAEIDTSFISSLRELDILSQFREHPNIVSLNTVAFGEPFPKKCFSPLSNREYKGQKDDKIHFFFDQASCDLHQFIYGKKIPNFEMLKNFMIDMLLGVLYLHDQNMMHRDIKPSNILIYGKNLDNAVAQICDFGLSKWYTSQCENTLRVVTTWYRAPEVVLKNKYYDYKIDIWALGCVFFEMIAKKNFINISRDNENVILSSILSKLNPPLSTQKLSKLFRKYPNIKISQRKTKNKSYSEQINLSKLGVETFNSSPGSMEEFCDLLSHMLVFSASKRYTVKECIEHPFFLSKMDYINETINTHPKKSMENPVMVHACLERKWMLKIATKLFNKRKNEWWYTDRILFHSMRIFDKFLVYKKYISIAMNEKKPIDSIYKGDFYDYNNTEIRFLTCVYLCVKYFLMSLTNILPFDKLLENLKYTEETMVIAEHFETFIIKDVLKYKIYEPSVYEAADIYNDKLSESEVRDLIILYATNTSFSGMLPSEIYYFYKKNIKGLPIEKIIEPWKFTI